MKTSIERKKDPERIEQAIYRNQYENNPTSLTSYSCFSLHVQKFFVKQTKFGKPVKPGKAYPNAFFSNLASVDYFHTYIAGILTLGFQGGVGKQLLASEKKQFKAYRDAVGLYQLIKNNKVYIKDGLYRYIVSPKGGLYIITKENDNWFHNAIRASQPVQCAGEVMITNHHIKVIGNESGHYRPTREQLLRTVGGLYAANFLNLDVRIKSFIIDSFFTYSIRHIGTLEKLIKQDEVKIPYSWEATAEFSNQMK